MFASAQDYSFEKFLAHHQSQLEAGGIPPELWGALHNKLKDEVLDAGKFFEIVCEQLEDSQSWSVLALKDMHPVDEECVFLIDHAWTFKPHEARKQLEKMPNLLERMKNIFDLNEEEEEEEEECSDDEVTTDKAENEKLEQAKEQAKAAGITIPRHESVDARLCYTVKNNDLPIIDKIIHKLWEYANTYTIRFKTNIDEDGLPQWYIMDEFGSRIGHADEPNARIVPLFYVPFGLAFNILFLIKPVQQNDTITRDYCDNAIVKKNPTWRNMLYLPWDPSYVAPSVSKRTELDPDFFSSGRNPDKLPSAEEQKIASDARKPLDVVRIFADDSQLIENLKDIKYELVDDWRKADVIWMLKHFHDFDTLCRENPRGLVNQFPFESCLTVKDLLSAVVMQMNNGQGPAWFQPSYNLNNELPLFVNVFQERAKSKKENTWIVKPWNLARGMDMHVSQDIGHIIRLIESGPKLACKYIDRPVLFTRPDNGNKVKFDLRYIIFVKSFENVEAYIFNNFWIRFSINEFSLDHLDDMETHFTVFNYADDGSKILQMRCEDFIKHFSVTYPNLNWADIQKNINTCILDMLKTVSSRKPPLGVSNNAQSRAMYGVDVMLQWSETGENSVQPTILECNFMPDCSRACNYYPDFADTMMKTLFLDQIDFNKVTAL